MIYTGAILATLVASAQGFMAPSPQRLTSLKMAEEQPWFPAHVKPEADAHTEGLAFLKTVEDVKWSYLSPPPMIQPGERTGNFNTVEGDNMIGQSVSAEDYAIAAVDEIDNPAHLRKRFAIAN